MRKSSLVLVLYLCLILVAPAASAQSVSLQDISLDDIPVEKLATNTVSRVRRAVSFGPYAGVMPVIPGAGDSDAALSFGLSVSVFKVPIIPDSDTIKRIVRERAQARLIKVVEAAARRGEKPTQEDLAELGREIIQQVLDEFLAERAPKVWEKPRFHMHLEAARLFRSGSWQSRTTAAIGLWRVSLGPSLLLDFADGADVFLGPELSIKLLPWKGPRSPVVDLFLRVDFALTDDARENLTAFGARFALDLI
jgi:hypothetical protein